MYIFDNNRQVWVLCNNKSVDFDIDYFDDSFWYDIKDSDLEEAIKDYVRSCDDFFESID